jgi:hypothetical protein
MYRVYLNMTRVPTVTLLLILAIVLPFAASQICDDNPLANNGVKISLQASSSCLKGRTSDMTEVASCQHNSAHDIKLPFAFKFLDRSYSGSGSGSVFVSSQSYVSFGGSPTASQSLQPRAPAIPTFFIGGRDNAMRNLSVGPDALGWRVRYEGWSLPSLVNVHNCSVAFQPSVVWELIFLYNNTLQLCTGSVMENVTGISAVSNGASDSFVQKFILTPSTLYSIVTGLGLCECDDDPQVRQGVKVTSQPSQSCLKGRSPDMIDVRSCRRAGSGAILLPFSFSFLGRTYGGKVNDVFVGDSSFVTFGGADGNFYSSFEADKSDLPALLIGARQNVLKTLSVAPDPLGWRVRYEGWSNHGASLDDYPTLLSAFSCNILPPSLAANITWELLFLFDGTLQLCTSSVMGNLDPVFDSFAIKERICSSLFSFANLMCSDFFQNLSAISAVSDGRSSSFVRKFDLMPSYLYTISTGVRQCPTLCDDNPQINKGVDITSQVSASCLKGEAPDMTILGRCQNSEAFSIRLPFPFHFLGRSYSGGDVFVGSSSVVTFGGSATTLSQPSNAALLIGRRFGNNFGTSNALKRLSVGPDPLGWRVRFEGWDTFLSPYDTVNCSRPANIVWELLFMFNSTMQLCTSSFMNNLDMALKPRAASGLWDGTAFVANFSLAASSVYSISTSLQPCSLEVSLSSPIASVNGSSLTVRFPVNLRTERHDSITVVITLQGAGFSVDPNTSISLITLPAKSQKSGTATISDSASSTPVLTVSLKGVANCSVLSFTLPSVSTPFLPQGPRKSIRFSVSDQNQKIIFTGDSGLLVEIVQNTIAIEADQPHLQLINSAVRSSTTVNISWIPNLVNIPAAFAPSALVVTLVGAGWSLASPAQGLIIGSQGSIVFRSATITADSSNAPVLRVTLSGPFSINSSSPLQLLLYNVTTAIAAQPAVANIHSALLNSAGSIIARGTNGRLDALVASTMGVGSPTLTFVPAVASATDVRIDVALNPRPLHQQNINLPARIIITFTGVEITCSASANVTFTSPFDASNGTFSISTAASTWVMVISMSSGTFLSGYPILFHVGPCSAPSRAQPRMANVSAAMIDGSGRTVAASSTGTLGEIVEDFGQPSLLLTDRSLSVMFTPKFLVPGNSMLIITLTGIGLVCNEAPTLQFSQPVSGAFGTASIVGRPLENELSVSFSTQFSAGVAIAFTVSPVYGSCFSNVGNLKSALFDNGRNLLTATATSSFSAKMTSHSQLTVQQFIDSAVNGVITIPEGTFAGKCNCNSRITENVPSRKADAPVEMKGTAGRSIIDCSGTGLRCLIVHKSSIRIVDIIFKGGSSPFFVSSSVIAAVRAIFDAENQTSTAQSYQDSRASPSARDNFEKDTHSRSLGVPMRLDDERDAHHDHRLRSDDGQSDAPSSSKDSLEKFGRQLLQSEPGHALSMFDAAVDESGGCIIVLAPLHSVSLSGVSLLRCSAIFGGGGFFNVSIFDAKNSLAFGNFARQGGGIFAAASKGADIDNCDFSNNTVAASSFSQRPSEFSVDPEWAAGAGAWLQRLNRMKQCKFEQNLALAAKTIAGSGPHALGSAVYVMQTSSGSILSDLIFFRSASLCAGAGCYSAGSVVIGFAALNTSIQGMSFIECHATAIRTMFVMLTSNQVEASGACISVFNSSAGMLKIERLHSTNCYARSSGAIFGGCMNFLNVNNAVISHISVIGYNSNASLIFSPPYLQSCGMGGMAHFAILKNTIILNVSVNYAKLQCMGKNDGAVMYAGFVDNVNITSIHASNIIYSGISEMKGGLLHIHQLGNVVFINISIQDSSFVGRKLDGPYILVVGKISERATGNILALRGGFVKSVYANAENNPPVDGYIAISSLLFFPLLFRGSACPAVTIENAIFQNVSIACAGDRCTNYGILDIITEMRETTSRTVSGQLQSLHVSNVSFENVESRCQGTGCSVRSACMALSIPDASMINIRAKNVSVSSNGQGSFAGGSLLFHLHSNPTKVLHISNVTSEDAMVSATGNFSTAIGGVLAAMYGNIIIDKARFLRSRVSCFGEACQSIGGSVAFASSLAPSNKRENNAFIATITNSELSRALVQCFGLSCEATGGGIFAGVSYRGPFDQTNPGGLIVFKGSVPLPLIVHFDNCSVTRNVISSVSERATLSGAGISILIAAAKINHSSILENIIQSTFRSLFVGGAGIYISGDGSSASIVLTIIKHNSAGINGSGGAIFAGPGSALQCEVSVLDFNSAAKGGGLFVDTASSKLYNSAVCSNSVTGIGGGIFCVNSLLLNATAAVILSNVTVFDNNLQNKQSGSVGAAVYIFGDVLLEVSNGTRISMNGHDQYPTTEAILSISRRSNISDSTFIFCKSGSVLSVAFTEVVNQKIKLAQPSDQEQFDSQCNPACLFTPEITPYVASGGFMASCIPCPRGTYSLTTSTNRTEKVAEKCQTCPFGAVCNGGSDIGALSSYWGWKVSESKLADSFVLLPPGYACEEKCTSISPCGGKRSGILCGACETNHSFAFFTTSCVPSAQCSSWKWVPLIFICITFQFIFSIWIIQYLSESDLLQNQKRLYSSSRRALEQVPLFQKLSPIEFDAVVSKMELVHCAARSNILVQGQPTSCMYIIETGVLSAFLLDGTGQEILLTTVVAPNVLGEQSFITGSACGASVRALVDSDLWRLDRSCLDNVAEDDKVSFARAKQTQYAKPVLENKSAKNRDAHDYMWHPLSVLMWFYQLAGIMLSVSSPLKYIDGSTAVFGFVSFFVNAQSSFQSFSDATTNTALSFGASDTGPFQFCVNSSMSSSQMYFANLMYYVSWAFLMAILMQKRVWKFARMLIIRFILGIAWTLDVASGCFKRSPEHSTISFATKLREQALYRQTIEIEIRGPAILKWFVTCFSAVASLMMQGTACVRLNGLLDAADGLRWFYDGRVVCFSDSGEFSGLWQIVPAIGVALALIAPALLWRLMLGIQQLDKSLRSSFQETLLNAYSTPYCSHACHWMVVM